MTREQQIRQAVIEHLRKTGSIPNWKTVGTTYEEGHPVFDAMIADGTLVWTVQVSPKGRKMNVLRLGNV
jgi:hypothetical protein